MAAPVYSEDLTDIALMEASESPAPVALNISGGGGGTPTSGADFAMQGSACWDKAASNAERAMAVVRTVGSPVIDPGVHIFQWGFTATPGITDTIENRGVYTLCGTGTGDYVQFHVDGNDTFGAAGRVGKCYVYDYLTTSNLGSPHTGGFRTVTGTPGATPTYFGFGIKTTASAKAANFGMDAVRYGTGAYVTSGDATTPGTFDGFATQNDSISNRWGIFTKVGSGFELQGKFVIGQDNTKTPTAAYFDSSDDIITIIDTPHSTSDFTQIIIDHASTTCNLTNLSINVAGDLNPGLFSVTSNNPTVNLTNVSFPAGFGTTTLRSNTTATNSRWSSTDTVTFTGATLDTCVFTSTQLVLNGTETFTDCTFNTLGSPALTTNGTNFTGCLFDGTPMILSGTELFTNCTFETLGSTLITLGADFTGCTINSTAMTLDSGVVLTNTYYQNPTNTTLTQSSATMTGCTFSSLNINNTTSVITANNPALITDCYFLESFSSNAGIEITATGTYTWDNITYDTSRWASGGGSNLTPSSGLATSFVYNNSGGLVTLNLANGSTIPTVRNGAGATTVVNSGSVTTQVTVLDANTGNPIEGARVYLNDTGSPITTYIFGTGGTLTNASGVVSDTRSFASDTAVSGWARKATLGPGSPNASDLYKTGIISGTVSSTTGLTITVNLISDI